MIGLGQPVVDSHQHFWDPETGHYPWMAGAYEPLRRRYEPADLVQEIGICEVDATIVVQARHHLEETRHLLRMAMETPWVVGVVGWVDLTRVDVADTIASLRESEGGQFLVGIRHQVHDEPDAEWLLRPDVALGLGAVADADLAYDLLVRSREIPAALKVARRFPELQLVLDHLGKPPVASGDLEPWARLISEFHGYENVTCKISGLVTEASWEHWRQKDLVPYIRTALDVFGPHRLLFGSDWPVCLLAATYQEVYEATVSTLRGLGADVESVLGGCAVRTYFGGLDPIG